MYNILIYAPFKYKCNIHWVESLSASSFECARLCSLIRRLRETRRKIRTGTERAQSLTKREAASKSATLCNPLKLQASKHYWLTL